MKALAAALSVGVVVGLTALSAAAAPRGTSRTVTFHLVEKQIGSNFIDNPPRQGFTAAPLIGDQFAFTSELSTKSGAHAGWVDATCTITRGGKNSTGPCYGVFSFKGGELMAIARVSFANQATQIVVVGGTGAYAGASGTIVSVSRGQNSSFSDDTFHLLLP